MRLIDDAEHAAKLARAIMSDISLYNGDRIVHAMDPERDLAEELGEGRELFRTRVAPRHHEIFEEAVRKWAVDVRARATPGAPSAQENKRAAVAEIEREIGGAEEGNRTRTAMILALVLIAVAAATFAFVSHERHHDASDKHEGAHH